MKTIGIFGDMYTASTGMAVVLRNLANQLSKWFQVIYFGRFGQEKEFSKNPFVPLTESFSYVTTEGGVWDRELVVRILKHYKEVDICFTEDDWFSSYGIVQACNFWDKPIHLLTPIDSLPIPRMAFTDVFFLCDKLYVPNGSWEMFNGMKRVGGESAGAARRSGSRLKSVFLPHGVDFNAFRPKKVQRSDKFTFLWTGRIEERKNPRAFVLAAEKIHNKMDADFFMRSDWNTPYARRLFQYIERKNLPFILDQMSDIPHNGMADVYNMGDVFVCTSKAGGFELSIIESMACGLTTIVTDWTFMNENIINGRSGFLVPVESFCHPPAPDPREKRTSDIARDRIWGNISIEGLANKMLWMYNNQGKVKAMGRWASAYARQRYDWGRIGEKLKKELME